MDREISVGEATRELENEYGESFRAGLEQGKEMMALTLQDRLKLSRKDAEKVVEACIEAHAVRWEGRTANIPMEQTGVSPVAAGRAEAGTWYL